MTVNHLAVTNLDMLVYRTKDPIVLAAEMINQWQTIASRENNPLDPIVVTVRTIHSSQANIIPDEVKMQLTVRTYKAEVPGRRPRRN